MDMKAIIEFLKEVWKGFEWAEQNRHKNQWGKF
jgi:hypothetical protein